MLGEFIAHYRIIGKLGEGGMGAVYRASDTKLGRDVAIKVLPDAFDNDADRLVRFTREAQVLASLSHPNIATIHGIEDGAIVMELVDGQTLAERIENGPVPVDEVLPIARQIAEALEAAHERNVIHRDLKPANIKITPEGTVKVLDFGLAKLADPREATDSPQSAPTVVRGQSPTMAGMIMGTAEYMSPEQAAGRPSTSAPISGHLVSSCGKCSRAVACSRAKRLPTRSRMSCAHPLISRSSQPKPHARSAIW